MPLIEDPTYTGGIVGGLRSLPEPPPVREPSTLSVLAAGARQSTIAGAAYQRLTMADPDDRDPVPAGWDPLDDVEGYEAFAGELAFARTPAELAGMKARVRAEQADRAVLTRAGLGGPVAEIVLNLADPSLLVALAVPELAMAKVTRVSRLARAAQAGAEGAAAAAAYETAMQGLQETRTAEESVFNIAGGTILSGLLGALGRGLSAPEREGLEQAIEAETRATGEQIRSEVGAAAVARPTTAERESLAAGGQAFADAARFVPLTQTDLQVVLRSESLEARQILQDLADVPGVLGKNLSGEATPTSVETLALMHEGRVAEFAQTLREQWKKYRERVPRQDRVTREEFESLVAAASRRLDRSTVPEAADAARALRAKVFDPLKRVAQEQGLLPGDVSPLAADSYFMRMYDRDAIRKDRGEWDSLLTSHFQSKGVPYIEARAIADDVTRRILGADRGVANFNLRVAEAGPLKDRVLDIRDELLERFLVNDPLKVAGAYVRELGPQIETIRKFGDRDLAAAFQRIKDDYGILRERAGGDAERLAKLQEEEAIVIEALARIRDRIYGTAGRLPVNASKGQRTAANILRGWRNLVGAAKLGATAITGGTMDLTRIMAQYGFLPTIKGLTRLATSPTFRNLSKQQARRLGVATEVALAKRVQLASDGAVTEGWTQMIAETTFKASGLNHVTDFLRTLTATLIEDRILKAASAVANKHALEPALKGHLASIGLTTADLRQIHALAQAAGETVDGLRTSGSYWWQDFDLAQKYDAAISKEARIAVMQPGAADRVWWTDSEIGKTLGQLKAFSLSSWMRMTIAPVQMVGQGRYLDAARFMGFMMVGGYLTHVMRQTIAGAEPVTDPLDAAQEALAETGLAGVLPDIVSPIARRFGLLGESVRYSDRNVTSAFGGPAVGTFVDLYDLVFNRTQGGLSAADLRALRRLIPMQNLWYLRRAINALEGEAAEALGLEGATDQTFAERMAETRPLPDAQARGATGTGTIQF